MNRNQNSRAYEDAHAIVHDMSDFEILSDLIRLTDESVIDDIRRQFTNISVHTELSHIDIIAQAMKTDRVAVQQYIVERRVEYMFDEWFAIWDGGEDEDYGNN